MTNAEFNSLQVGDKVYWGNNPLRVIAVCDDADRRSFDRAWTPRAEWPPRRKRGRVLFTAELEFDANKGPDISWYCHTSDIKALTLKPRGEGRFDWETGGGAWVSEVQPCDS